MRINFASYTGLLGVLLVASPILANSGPDLEMDLINSPSAVLDVPMGASSKGKGKGSDPVWTGQMDPGQIYVNPGQNVPQPGQVPGPGQAPVVYPQQQQQHSTGLIFADPQYNTVHQPETAPSAPHTYHAHQTWNQPTNNWSSYYYNNSSSAQGSWYWNGYSWSFQYSYNYNTRPQTTWNNYNYYNWNNNQYNRWHREQLRQLSRRTDQVRSRLQRLANAWPRNSYYRNYYNTARQSFDTLRDRANRGDRYAEQQLTWYLSSWESYLGIGNYYYGQSYAYRN